MTKHGTARVAAAVTTSPPSKSTAAPVAPTSTGTNSVPELTSAASEIEDFGVWEQAYGQVLDDAERLEIKANMLGFFAILLDQSSRRGMDQNGVRKNQ